MFHTYVFAASGNVVDFDRAAYLMDRALLDQSIAVAAEFPDINRDVSREPRFPRRERTRLGARLPSC